MLPKRFFLINQNHWKGVLLLEIIHIHDTLRLRYSLHRFRSQLTSSLIQSFEANSENEAFFNKLPIEKVWSADISLNQAEEHVLYLEQLIRKCSNYGTNNYVHIYFHYNWSISVPYVTTYGIYNFEANFTKNYYNLKNIFLQQINLQKNAVPETNKFEYVDNSQVYSDTYENVEQEETQDSIELETDNNQTDKIQFVNDCIKLSPNSLTSYFITKLIHNYLATDIDEDFNFNLQNNVFTIEIKSLIDIGLLSNASNHQMDYFEVLNSFNFSINEYYAKLRLSVNQILFMTFNYYNNKCSKDSLLLPFKILEFLIFIYGCKCFQYEHHIITNFDPLTLNNFILYVVNNSIQKQFAQIDQSNLNFNILQFTHILQENSVNKVHISKDDFNSILMRQRHMLDIDRDTFLNNVFEEINEKESNLKKQNKKISLLLNNPRTISIDNILESNSNTNNSLLNYQIIQPQQKQLRDKKKSRIITPEYLNILQIDIMPEASLKDFLKQIDNRIKLNAQGLLNDVFKVLNSDIQNYDTVSTLYLLMQYIRPYLGLENSIHTELFILFRIVIPYLYDMKYVNHFVDYFH